ncbi:MAG TPA: hypothetical protein VF476_04480 [Chitinophagaceae bacterium]
MTTLLNSPEQEFPVLSYELHWLADEVIQGFASVATRNNCSIINDISEDICIDADRELVASVLAGMVSAIMAHAKDSWIQLSAKAYGDVILVHVRDHNTVNSYAVESGLYHLQSLTDKLGGFIGVSSQRKKLTTVAFSFPNLPLAA